MYKITPYLFLELLAKTDNLYVDEVDDATKTPLERPLEATDSNKRSRKVTSKLSDKITKLEGDSSQKINSFQVLSRSTWNRNTAHSKSYDRELRYYIKNYYLQVN